MPQDPYADIAKPLNNDDPYASIATQAGNIGAQVTKPSNVGQYIGQTAKGFGIGAAKGAGSSLNALGSAMIPDRLVKAVGATPPTPEQKQSYFAPKNTSETIGKGLEQAGEFLIPGGGEEALAAKAAEHLPSYLGPATRAGTSALASGAVNKLQGGSFGTGALAGGVSNLAGQGLKAMAPRLAESSLGIRKADRGFGKTPGEAIINETTGVRPGTVADSAQNRINSLTSDLESRANQAGVRPQAKIRGLLQAPQRDIPLANSPNVEGSLSEPTVLHQPDRPMRTALSAPQQEIPLGPRISDRPEPNAGTLLRPFEGSPASGMGPAEYIGQVSGERGGLGGPQGVLRTRTPEPGLPVGKPTPFNPARTAPALGIIDEAMAKAQAQNAPEIHGALSQLRGRLTQNAISGEEIPGEVSPRQILDLKRGVGTLDKSWNPELRGPMRGTMRNVYGALDSELDRTVPGAQGLNQRISSLIPVAQRGESAELNAPLAQRVMGRLGAHTGALIGSGMGATAGYHEGGLPGAIAGGLTGAILPEALASPTAQMIGARALNRSVPNFFMPAARGLALQADRKDRK